MKDKNKVTLFKIAIHLFSLLPVTITLFLAFSDELGADPVKALIHFTGVGALNLLLISLIISPLAKYTKKPFLLKVRRLVGLYAFSYAVLHILSFLAFDLQFDFALFVNELLKRPYIWVGMVSFVILLSMAVTSVNSLKRKMGRQWQQLHNFVYLAVILSGIHFYWSVKSDIVEPVIYIMITLLLLIWRKHKFTRWFS